jgi:hypothetical protein
MAADLQGHFLSIGSYIIQKIVQMSPQINMVSNTFFQLAVRPITLNDASPGGRKKS